MIKKFLKMVKKDLEMRFDLKNIDMSDILRVHFQVCLYIRNKYLWHNKTLTNSLLKHFSSENVDDLSLEILKTIKKDYD